MTRKTTIMLFAAAASAVWAGAALAEGAAENGQPPAASVQEPAQKPSQPAALSAKMESLNKWFKNWKNALEKSAVEGRYRKTRSTAVAAVRGAGQTAEDPTKPFWKGTWSAKKLAERNAERQELASAVDLLLGGKLEEGVAGLDAFEKKHPYSTLLEDVREARGKAADLMAEGAGSPEPVPAAQPEEKKAEPAAAAEPVKPAEPLKAEDVKEPPKAEEPAKAVEPAKAEESAKP